VRSASAPIIISKQHDCEDNTITAFYLAASDGRWMLLAGRLQFSAATACGFENKKVLRFFDDIFTVLDPAARSSEPQTKKY